MNAREIVSAENSDAWQRGLRNGNRARCAPISASVRVVSLDRSELIKERYVVMALVRKLSHMNVERNAVHEPVTGATYRVFRDPQGQTYLQIEHLRVREAETDRQEESKPAVWPRGTSADTGSPSLNFV